MERVARWEVEGVEGHESCHGVLTCDVSSLREGKACMPELPLSFDDPVSQQQRVQGD